MNDFTPIAPAARAGFMLVVSANSPAKTFQDFAALARAKPDALMYGAVTGTSNHLIMEMIKGNLDLKVRHIAYRGAAQAITDVVGGQIDLTVASIPSVLGYLNAGTMRALGVTGGTRSDIAPNVPTIAEAGMPGFDITHWWGLLGPAKMDPQLVALIARDVTEIAKSEAFRAVLEKQGAEPFVASTAAFGKLLADDIEKWGAVTRKIGFQQE